VARSERATDRFLNNITLGELVNNREIQILRSSHNHESQRTRAQDAIDVKLRA
jgi:hypothetical protein